MAAYSVFMGKSVEIRQVQGHFEILKTANPDPSSRENPHPFGCRMAYHSDPFGSTSTFVR
jgi:hypothetical protein